jgi:hypothetical protein
MFGSGEGSPTRTRPPRHRSESRVNGNRGAIEGQWGEHVAETDQPIVGASKKTHTLPADMAQHSAQRPRKGGSHWAGGLEEWRPSAVNQELAAKLGRRRRLAAHDAASDKSRAAAHGDMPLYPEWASARTTPWPTSRLAAHPSATVHGVPGGRLAPWTR